MTDRTKKVAPPPTPILDLVSIKSLVFMWPQYASPNKKEL